ncbi:MOSC domain-containing protein [Actinoplanes sp. TFC3]|uniref:MOSC domain-containing protein n=1 Tax=Actinoplanes sp. TFC3 TaxID=1710355 RepID=UPI00083470CA|nr:MOSC N-terminal beta barrel domain-containing protein [Actinoplanes sp. TFC3]
MRIASLHTYPVKGCHRLDHDQAVIEPWGFAGDRRWMVIDSDGVGITQRQAPALTQLHAVPQPGGVLLNGVFVAEPVDGPKIMLRVFSSKPPVTARLAAGGEALLTGLLGRPARLAWLADPTARPIQNNAQPGDRVSFADGFPVQLANEASLAALGLDVPMTRFRPNIVVTGAEAWAEDGWLGGRLTIGGTTFRAAEACGRCLVTTIDQDTGEGGQEPLRTLGRLRRVNGKLLFGLLLIPDIRPGETRIIRQGDAVLSVS